MFSVQRAVEMAFASLDRRGVDTTSDRALWQKRMNHLGEIFTTAFPDAYLYMTWKTPFEYGFLETTLYENFYEADVFPGASELPKFVDDEKVREALLALDEVLMKLALFRAGDQQ